MLEIIISTIILSESFESNFPPSGWVKLDLGTSSSDGWQRTTSKKRTGNYSAYVSYSPPNNMKNEWLITPAINLSSYTKAFLIFYEDQEWWGSYGLYHRIRISTTSQTDTSTFTIVKEMTPNNHQINGFSGDPVLVDISSFTGNSTVYIAFQYVGQDEDNWFIDDVQVFIPYDYDVKPLRIVNPKPFVGSGNILPTIRIINYGIQNVSNVPVRLKIKDHNNNLVYEQVLNVNSLNSFDSTTLSFPSFTGNNEKVYKLELITELANDQDRTNDTLRMNVYTYTTPQKPLFERFTNTSCGPCAIADPYMEQIYETYLYNIGFIVYHTWWPAPSDPFYVYNTSQNQLRTYYYGVNAVPWVWINGVVNGKANYTSWQSLVEQEMNYRKTPIIITFNIANSFVSSSGNGQISFNINQIGEMEDEIYKIRVAIVEDSIYYSAANGTNFHPMTFRTLIEDSFIPQTGQNITKTYNFTFKPDLSAPDNPDSVNFDKLVAVVFIQRDNDKSVWAVDVYKFETIDVVENVNDKNLFLLRGKIFLFNLNEQKVVNVRIFNVSGRLVIDKSFDIKNKLEYTPKLNKGIYIYNVEIGGRKWEGKLLYY